MRPERKCGPRADADGDSQRVAAQGAARVAHAVAPVTATRNDEQYDRPDQEGAEEDDVMQEAGGQQVAEGPDLGSGQHRMANPVLDVVARHIGSSDEDEGDQGEQGVGVLQCDGRHVEQHRLLPGQTEAPDDQHEADKRHYRVDPLPAAFAELRDHALTKSVGKYAR